MEAGGKMRTADLQTGAKINSGPNSHLTPMLVDDYN